MCRKEGRMSKPLRHPLARKLLEPGDWTCRTASIASSQLTRESSAPRRSDRDHVCKGGRQTCRLAALAARVRSSVQETVNKQRRAGIDIVNDGEMSKPSYATYIKDRLSGFGGEETVSSIRTWRTFPIWPSGCSAIRGDPGGKRPLAMGQSQSPIPKAFVRMSKICVLRLDPTEDSGPS